MTASAVANIAFGKRRHDSRLAFPYLLLNSHAAVSAASSAFVLFDRVRAAGPPGRSADVGCHGAQARVGTLGRVPVTD